MAETFVFGMAQNLLIKIASLARDEVALAWGLETDLRKLQELLRTVKAVLLDAEKKQAQSHELGVWLGKLKDFYYDAEDVLDELEYKGIRQAVLKVHGNTKSKARHFFSNSNPLIFRHKMGHKVKELRERLDEIADHRLKFHLEERVDSGQAGRSREMTDSLLGTSNVIGRDGDKEKILDFLFDQKEGETLSVIPIVGLGGMGKTTLAKMIYNDRSVKDHFDPKIWVCASDKFEKKQLMVSMIKSLIDKDHSKLEPDQLQRKIQENLYSKRFLLVLDDVWSNDRGKWIEFRELLEVSAVGSKVIVTTRNDSVADIVRTVPSHRLKGLSNEKCLSLFKKLAFREGEEESHPHLMQIGDEIVKKCRGIPLAVKTMGTLLYSKIDEHYWKFIRDSETWKLEQKEGDILPTLKLSYDQLPFHLKPCFAICSIYPKDHNFSSSQLSQIWLANGLLHSSNEQRGRDGFAFHLHCHSSILSQATRLLCLSNEQRGMEDIAVQYIKELYSRSFLQDFEEAGGDMFFKMHDLVHDLAMSISQSECFVVNSGIEKVPNEIRHLSFSKKASLDQEVSNFIQKENSLRTIIFPWDMKTPPSESFVNTCISASKYLRMIQLGNSPLEVLQISIGGLKHLRSLNLGHKCNIKRLPYSFWKLHNLLYLNLSGCSILEELPRDVRNLIKLRYLHVRTKQKRLPDHGIGCLEYLEVLYIWSCSNLEYLFEDIHNLVSLRCLLISDCEKLISLPRSFGCLNVLEDLCIRFCERFNWREDDGRDFISIRLRYLVLIELPHVKILPGWLSNSSTLQRLEVHNCKNFSSFPEWPHSFSSLEEIKITGCPNLVSLPRWMRDLTTLKDLWISGCPVLSERCKRFEGEDWHNIAHVRNIYIDDLAYADTGASSTVDVCWEDMDECEAVKAVNANIHNSPS